MTTKITADNIEPQTLENLGSGPLIANVLIASNTYVALDDTAISLDGGFIIINGSKFESNVNVLIDGIAATSVTHISQNELRAQVGSSAAGSKIVYVVNTDTGATAILVNGLTYSGTPTWVTGSSLPDQGGDSLITIQLSATSDSNVSYSLVSGSTLPGGITLASNGLLSGTVTGLEEDTLYNFTIEAIDQENQESPRSFSVTIQVSDQYFSNTVLLLTGDGSNGAQNNTFLDSSTNNFTINRNGNPIQGSFNPFPLSGKYSLTNNSGSVYLDGTDDFLSIASNSAFDFPGDFTIEFFLRIPNLSNTTYQRIMSRGGYQSGTGDWLIVTRPSEGTVFFQYGNPNVTNGIGSNVLSANTWHHIAFSRQGTTFRMFVDGILRNGPTISANLSNSRELRFGTNYNGNEYFQGHISSVRIVKGTALYTSNFTKPTVPPTNISGTSLLCNFTNAGIFDNTGKNNLETVGNAQIDTTTKKYGTGSMEFDGTGDSLLIPSSPDMQMGSGDFTWECWVYMNSLAASFQGIIDTGTAGARTTGGLFYFATSTLHYYSNNANIISSASFPTGTWKHIAVTRSGSTVRLFVDGVQAGSSGTSSTNMTSPILYVGNTFDNFSLNGYIDDLRITKGVARYTENFTPPTRAHALRG